jgi:hypothetical protein
MERKKQQNKKEKEKNNKNVVLTGDTLPTSRIS